MKISQMLIRENFYSINEETLKSYYKQVHAIDVDVSTRKLSLLNKTFVYPKINTIISRFPSYKVIQYVFNEFNVRGNLIKYIYSKIYTALCLYTGGIMASKTLLFFNNSPVDKNTLIWPCNRKIRIFDFKNNYVDSIIKNGFTNKYFYNEISFRINSRYSFVPKIIDFGNSWYRETILSGQTLARINDKNQFIKCRNDVINYLKIIIKDSVRYIDANKYSDELYIKVDKLISKAKKRKKITTETDLYKIASIAARKAKCLKSKIPIAISHGDLQEGNIWIDKTQKKTFIIDWETNDYRSIWYDSATLLLSTRKSNGIYNMFKNYNTANVANAILINDDFKEYEMEGVVGVLILEDIIFCLEDNLELPLDWGNENIDQFSKQLKQIKWT